MEHPARLRHMIQTYSKYAVSIHRKHLTSRKLKPVSFQAALHLLYHTVYWFVAVCLCPHKAWRSV